MTPQMPDRSRRPYTWIPLLAALALSLFPASALSDETPLVLSETQLNALLASSSISLRAYVEPDKALVGSQYLGLLRDDKPVGYELFSTEIVQRRGVSVYSFDDRAFLRASEDATVRITSLGFSDRSFSGLQSSLHLLVTGPSPADLTSSASRAGDVLHVDLPLRGDAPAQSLRIDTAGKVVALSGELQRLIRLRKWQPGDLLALWHLDLANGSLEPVVLRARDNSEKTLAGRPLGPVKVETWAQADPAHPALVLQTTTYFDLAGAVTLVTRPDGLTKLVISKSDFDKDWAPKFAPP